MRIYIDLPETAIFTTIRKEINFFFINTDIIYFCRNECLMLPEK
jgi:hypothetical protein